MKIAVASEDGVSISRHFGRSTCYMIFEATEEKIDQLESRPAVGGCGGHGHDHDHNQSETHDHNSMVAPIADCAILVCGGIGQAAVEAVAAIGVLPVGAPEGMDAATAVKLAATGTFEKHHGCNCTCKHD